MKATEILSTHHCSSVSPKGDGSKRKKVTQLEKPPSYIYGERLCPYVECDWPKDPHVAFHQRVIAKRILKVVSPVYGKLQNHAGLCPHTHPPPQKIKKNKTLYTTHESD